MKQWLLTLNGPSGLLGTFESGVTQFGLGTEEAADVLRIQGEGIAPRHAWVWLEEERMEVEDLGGGMLVNGYAITGRVEVEYPLSVQVGEVTLVVEVKRALGEVVPVLSTEVTIPQRGTRQTETKQTAASLAVTIPQRVSTNRVSNTAVTIPQRPLREEEKRRAESQVAAASQNKAPLSGEYTLVREIARGGMGQIYFGEDPQLKRQVAVKVSSVACGGEDPRFSKEAEVLAHLAHPNIVPIYNIGVDAQRRPFYSMKLVKGRTLQAVLHALRAGDAAAMKEYTRAALLTVFRKVCDALAFAHSKGVLHRDLKPENIMVGEYGEVLVMDWGLAKVLGGSEDVVTDKAPGKDSGDYGMTMEGEVMGTPQYMSPEQAEGMVAELDARSDIYSLGGVLYALLSLRAPIDGTTLDEVLTKVKKGEISSMATKRGSTGGASVGGPEVMGVEVPEALQAVTLKAMATDRSARYASVEEFAADIEAYQNGFATQAEGAGVLRQLLLLVKRHRAVSALAVVLLLSGGVFTVRLAQSERRALEHARIAGEQTLRAQEQTQIAEANAKRALEEKEVARRLSAKAQISLAETAEKDEDGEGMRAALDAIDPDLRDQFWRYLDQRLDTSVLTYEAKDSPFLKVLPHPKNNNTFVTIQANGWVRSLEVPSGKISDICKVGQVGGGGGGAFAISSDGRMLAKAGRNGSLVLINIWRLDDGEQLLAISDACTAGIKGLFFSPDGKRLLLNTSDLSMRDVKTGEILWSRESGGPLAAEFSGDGKQVCLLSYRDGMLDLEAETGKVSRVINSSLHISNGFMNNTGWFYTTGNRIGFINKQTGSIESTRIENRPISQIRKGGVYDRAISVCRRSDGCLILKRIRQNQEFVGVPFFYVGKLTNGFDVTVHGSNYVALRNGGQIKVWHVSDPWSGTRASAAWNRTEKAGSVLRAQQYVGERLLRFRTLDSGSIVELFHENDPLGQQKPSSVLTDVLISNSNDQISISRSAGLAVAQNSNAKSPAGAWEVQVVEITGGSLKTGGAWPLEKELPQFCLSPDGGRLWGGNGVYEAKTGKLLQSMDRNGLEVPQGRRVSFWPQRDRILELAMVANEDSSVKSLILWDAAGGRRLRVVEAPYCKSAEISPDCSCILEGGADGKVRFRSAETLEVEKEFRVEDGEVTSVSWHPSLPLFVTNGPDRWRIWDRNGERLWESGGVVASGVLFSPNGKSLIPWAATETNSYEPPPFGAAGK